MDHSTPPLGVEQGGCRAPAWPQGGAIVHHTRQAWTSGRLVLGRSSIYGTEQQDNDYMSYVRLLSLSFKVGRYFCATTLIANVNFAPCAALGRS